MPGFVATRCECCCCCTHYDHDNTCCRFYADTYAANRAQSEPDLRPGGVMERPPRYFVALYDYDPRHMSPNPSAPIDELAFRKGQVIRVYGTKDMDGFYRGELHGRVGLVPGNMVAEISADEAFGAGQGDYSDTGGMGMYSLRTSPRRQSDGWQNTSDPTLAGHRGGLMSGAPLPTGYYGEVAGPSGQQLADPRMRRLRFGQGKSQSYDHPSEYGRRQAPGYSRRAPCDYPYYPDTAERLGWAIRTS